jgi:hypothetical protein
MRGSRRKVRAGDGTKHGVSAPSDTGWPFRRRERGNQSHTKELWVNHHVSMESKIAQHKN